MSEKTVDQILRLVHDPVIQGAISAVALYIANRARKEINKLKNGGGDAKIDERLRYHNILPPMQSEPEPEVHAVTRLKNAYKALRGGKEVTK